MNCEIHKELKEYWIWGMREEEEEENESFMIQWDYWGKFSITNFLDNWYHGECIGISSQDGGKYDTFWWQQWEKWQDKRQNLLYKIWTTQTISMDILKDIKNYTKGILPEISKNIKLIDYLIITQAWNKITNILLSLWREIPVIVDHLRVVEQIPINWESKVWKLIEKIKQNLISAVGIVSNFEQLKDLKVLDVVDEDKKIIEQNLEKNQNIFVKLSEAWKDLDQSKVIKWPGLLILQSNIKLIDILNRVAKFYDEESTEEKSIEEYKELFQSLKSTTYQGWLFDIMDQEIADFDKFKKDTEDILNEENNQDNVIDEEELNSDDDDSPLALLEYKTKAWKSVLANKIDKKNFINTINNGKELKVDVLEYLEKLEKIEIKWTEFELKLNKNVIWNSHKLDMNEVEQIILEGIALNIVPKSTLLKAINLYQKLEKFRVLTESMLNSDFDNRVKYKDLKNLVKSLDKLSFNKHPISKVQLDQLESLYQSWKSVKVEVNKLESTNIKELESIWRHTRKKTQIDLPWIEALHRKILILKLLSQDANDDSIDSTIPEIQQAFDDFSNKTFTVPKIDFEDAWNKLKKRINYTIQVMKRRRKEDTIECIQNDIKNLKQKGILLSSFDSEYCNSQRSHDWYKIVISEIHRMYDEVAMKDTNDKFEPLEEYRQLQFLTLQQVNQFLGSKSNINEICGVEPRKLLRSLNCIKWIFEYKSCIDYSTNGELSQDDAKRLVKIGKELKLKDEDIPEFSTLYESQKYLDLFDKFVNDENCFDSLDKLLKMKTSSSLEKLKGIMPKVEDNPKKKAKLEEIIEHMKLSMLLGKATKMLRK